MKKVHVEKIGNRVHRYEYDTGQIKTECVDCGKRLKNPEANYIKMGNYCQECNSRYGGTGKVRHHSRD